MILRAQSVMGRLLGLATWAMESKLEDMVPTWTLSSCVALREFLTSLSFYFFHHNVEFILISQGCWEDSVDNTQKCALGIGKLYQGKDPCFRSEAPPPTHRSPPPVETGPVPCPTHGLHLLCMFMTPYPSKAAFHVFSHLISLV